MNFNERKQMRKENFENNIKGYKLIPCESCNGSGYYDYNSNPDCYSCDGTGKERMLIPDLLDIKKLTGETLELEISEGVNMRIYVKNRNCILYRLLGENSHDTNQYKAKLTLNGAGYFIRPLVHHKTYNLKNFKVI